MWWWATAALALQPAVRDAVMVHDCDAVFAALPAPEADDERLAVGACLAQRATPGAAEVLAPVAGPLASWARWTAAEALADEGRYDEALSTLDGLTLPGEPGLRVRLLRGRCLVQAERSLQAREDLRTLLDTAVGVEARYWLALGGEQRGEITAAQQTYERVWIDATRGPWAVRAAEALARLGAPVPDPATTHGRDLIAARARTLRADKDFPGEARLLALLPKAGSAAASSPLEQARAEFRAKDYAAAMVAYKAALGPPDAATGSPSDLFDFALGMSRTGDYDTAAVLYARLVTLHPTSKQADEASFKLGYLEYDRRACDAARARFAEHLERYPDSEHGAEALWFSARCAWRSDRPAADALFEQLVARWPASSLAPGAAYWRARALHDHDPSGGVAALAKVRSTYPRTVYAWLADQRTTASSRGGDPSRAADPPRSASPEVAALLDAGFPGWARAVQGDTPAEPELFTLLGEYKRGRTGGLTPEQSIVQRIAATCALDPGLPLAIMTAESGLDASVTSYAGARGLMQMMPAEAPRVHRHLFGDQPFDPDWLYEGPYNAALGTALLCLEKNSLGDVLDGSDLPAVIAAYNGGPDAVRRWVGAYDRPPTPDTFIEDIGYTETRQYVKRVLGYLMR